MKGLFPGLLRRPCSRGWGAERIPWKDWRPEAREDMVLQPLSGCLEMQLHRGWLQGPEAEENEVSFVAAQEVQFSNRPMAS